MKKLCLVAVFAGLFTASEPARACDGQGAMVALRGFNSRWAIEDYPPVPVTLAELEAAEAELVYRYPDTYRSAVLQVGLPRPTADLWDAIGEADLPHLGDFLSPKEAVEAAEGWGAAGFPNDLVPFASDSSGNLLAFRKTAAGDAVWLWDHDFDTTEQIASSFEGLIAAYCRLPSADS